MLRFFAFGCVLGFAASAMAQSGTPSTNQHAGDTAESAWVEMMPSLVPPPMAAAAPAPKQDQPKTIRISGGVMAGQVLSKVDPVYPPDAKANHMQGAVVLSAKIGADGTVQDLQAISGPEVLCAAALDAVRQWTYKPYLLNGTPVTVLTTVTVNFHLHDAPAP